MVKTVSVPFAQPPRPLDTICWVLTTGYCPAPDQPAEAFERFEST